MYGPALYIAQLLDVHLTKKVFSIYPPHTIATRLVDLHTSVYRFEPCLQVAVQASGSDRTLPYVDRGSP
jgi:hypothetical protein